MDEGKRQPKISLPEAIFIGLFIAFLDVLDLIPLVGDFTDIIAAPVMFYLLMKGVNGTLFVLSEVLDLIPGIQEFPCRSIAWWATVIIDRFAPAKVAELTEKAGEAFEGEAGEGIAEGGIPTTDTVTAISAEGGAAGGAATAVGEVGGGIQEGNSIERKTSGATNGTNDSLAEDNKKDSEIDKEMATEAEREPEEVLQNKLLGEEPLVREEALNADDEDEEVGRGAGVVVKNKKEVAPPVPRPLSESEKNFFTSYEEQMKR